MRSIVRLLDANANRAREALRVMEDAARFLLDDRALARRLKGLRHDLAAALRPLDRSVRGLPAHRDTPGDVGTTVSTPSERSRDSARDVVIAAGKRLTEALRCLEEYSKPFSADGAALFEQIRYRAYDVEKALHERLGPPGARQWRLCLVLTESLCRRGWLDVARAALEAGADCLQLREKNLDGRELLDRAARLVALSHAIGTGRRTPRPAIIVNDRPDIAAMAQADGVHLGQGDPPPDAVRRWLGPERLIGVSTHNLTEARRAAAARADYCGVGAIFPTATKARRPSGLKYLRTFLARCPDLPHLAIGGITPENVASVIEAGARGVAVSSVVCAATNPGAVTRKLLRAIPR